MPPLPAIATVATASLSIHPAAAAVPMLRDDDPGVKALMESVCELGVLEPLKICRERIVDGRIRHKAAKFAGLENVPSVEIQEGEVASVIVHSLTARAHLTKGARAYLIFPVVEDLLSESRRRRLDNLRRGTTPGAGSSRPGNTTEEIGERLGINRKFLYAAKSLHQKFSEFPRLREKWEPLLLSGEMGIGQVQQAIAGKIAALEGNTFPKGDPHQLLLDLFGSARVRFDRWKKLTAPQREEITTKFCTSFLTSLPHELAMAAEKRLREMRQERQAK